MLIACITVCKLLKRGIQAARHIGNEERLFKKDIIREAQDGSAYYHEE